MVFHSRISSNPFTSIKLNKGSKTGTNDFCITMVLVNINIPSSPHLSLIYTIQSQRVCLNTTSRCYWSVYMLWPRGSLTVPTTPLPDRHSVGLRFLWRLSLFFSQITSLTILGFIELPPFFRELTILTNNFILKFLYRW